MCTLIFSKLLTTNRRRKPSLIEEGKCTPLFRSQPVPFRVLNQSLLHLISIATTFCHGGNPGDQEMEAFFPTTAYLSLTGKNACASTTTDCGFQGISKEVCRQLKTPSQNGLHYDVSKQISPTIIPFDLPYFLQLPLRDRFIDETDDIDP